jgi:hypothetical protein
VIRRSLLVACALVGAVTLSSCSTFSDNDAVARVGDVELTRDTLEEFVHDYLATTGEVPTQVAGDGYRQIIGAWVIEELIRQKLADDGVQPTDADITAANAAVESDLANLPTEPSEAVRQFVYDKELSRAMFSRTQEQGSLGEFASASSIMVDPRYGYWDSSSGTVLPMQS